MAYVFSIEGNIGSGKSTLLKILKQQYAATTFNERSIIFMEEPVSEWTKITDEQGCNMIEKFYGDQDTYAFSFQMMAYISRLSMLKKCIKENPDAIIICERSLYTDKYVFAKMLYDDGKIEMVNFKIYMKWFEDFIEDIPYSGIIYVKTDPNVSCQRVVKRSRPGEIIPLSYLENCHSYHEKWMDSITSTGNLNILYLPGDENKTCDADYDSWIQKIMGFMKYQLSYVPVESANVDTHTSKGRNNDVNAAYESAWY